MYVRSIWEAFHVTKSFTVSMLDITRSLNIDLFNLWFLYDWAVKTYNPFWLPGILQQCRCIKKKKKQEQEEEICKSTIAEKDSEASKIKKNLKKWAYVHKHRESKSAQIVLRGRSMSKQDKFVHVHVFLDKK